MVKKITNTEIIANELLIEKYRPLMVIKLSKPTTLRVGSNLEKFALDISDKSLEIVIEGMRQVADTGGTAFPFFDFKVKGERIYVAAKTGTAEFGDPEDKTHAWLTAYGPIENPNIVVTVLREAAGEGSYQAAPIAKDLLSYWFSRQ